MASVGAAVRTAITSASISGITGVFRDIAPDSTALPFVTLASELGRGPVLQGDGSVLARTQEMQVDLWQSHESEDVTLVESLLAALDSATLTGADKNIFQCRVVDVVRDVQPEIDICHHSLSLDVTHTN